MKYIEEYLKDVIKVKPLGELTTMDDTLYGMSGEMVYIDGKCSGIFVSHADYVNWLEKQDEKHPVPKWKYKKDNTPLLRDSLILNKYGRVGKSPSGAIVSDVWVIDYDELAKLPKEDFEKQGEQVPTEKIEPKFKVGDWISHNTANFVYQVVSFGSCGYEVINRDNYTKIISFDNEDNYHLWTIQDAKDGDVLSINWREGDDYWEKIIILKKYHNKGVKGLYNMPCVEGYGNTFKNGRLALNEEVPYYSKTWTCNLYPATKEQSDLLFQKMKEAGYKWENNQLEEINNKGVVDLGLPSGTLWAKCNLGAEKETDFGLFYQWGDTKGYKGLDKDQFDWNSYKYGSSKNFTKYNENDTKLILDNEDDPVFVATKGKFKSPTKEQLKELITHTNHEWTIIDGVNGMKFWKMGTEESTDSNSYIFIPAAGECLDGNRFDVESWGYVWSSSYNKSFASRAWSMCFDVGDIYVSDSSRCNGFSVRGVVVPQAETLDEIDDSDDGQPVDLGLPSGTKWMKSNIGATKPSDFGKFFQWGDTQGYSGVDEHQFNWNDYQWGNYDNITKYNNTDHLTLLVSNDDSAFVATSGSASMPTKDQVQELIDNTEHRWLRLANDINGMKFWKKGTEEPTESNSYIFIPAAGDCCDGNHSDVGSWGYIWSAYSDESIASSAWSMYFDADDVYVYHFTRCLGYSVRGILREKC